MHMTRRSRTEKFRKQGHCETDGQTDGREAQKQNFSGMQPCGRQKTRKEEDTLLLLLFSWLYRSLSLSLTHMCDLKMWHKGKNRPREFLAFVQLAKLGKGRGESIEQEILILLCPLSRLKIQIHIISIRTVPCLLKDTWQEALSLKTNSSLPKKFPNGKQVSSFGLSRMSSVALMSLRAASISNMKKLLHESLRSDDEFVKIDSWLLLFARFQTGNREQLLVLLISSVTRFGEILPNCQYSENLWAILKA